MSNNNREPLNIVCVGCHYIKDNILEDLSVELDWYSLAIVKSPVDVDPTAIGVFLNGVRIGFIPKTDKDHVRDYVSDTIEGFNKAHHIKVNNVEYTDTGKVKWFEVTLEWFGATLE